MNSILKEIIFSMFLMLMSASAVYALDTDNDSITDGADNDGVLDVDEGLVSSCESGSGTVVEPKFGPISSETMPDGSVVFITEVTNGVGGEKIGEAFFITESDHLSDISSGGAGIVTIELLTGYEAGNKEMLFTFKFVPEPGVYISKGDFEFIRGRDNTEKHAGEWRHNGSSLGNPIYETVGNPTLLEDLSRANGDVINVGDDKSQIQ